MKYRNFDLENAKPVSLSFLNFILLISKLKIDVDLECFDRLKNLDVFESWLLNPKKFDYRFFDSDWLIVLSEYPTFLERLANIADIVTAIEE